MNMLILAIVQGTWGKVGYPETFAAEDKVFYS